MGKLNFFICENFVQEFHQVVEELGFDDVSVTPYPCLCENKGKKSEVPNLLADSMKAGDKGVVLCSNYCEVLQLLPAELNLEVQTTNYCFNHLASEPFINYILERGGYIIGANWLQHWEEHIATGGFDKDTARRFYQEFCKEIVFFDAGIDPEAENNLMALSQFLGLPHVIIPFELEAMQLMIKTAVLQWRLLEKDNLYTREMSEVRAQCAEYAAILDVIGKIASYSNTRDTIERIKEIFILVLGAQKFKYWDRTHEYKDIPEDVRSLFDRLDEDELYVAANDRFSIKIAYKDKVYGVIDVSDFLFPQYFQKYLNFALEIAKVCGLVLSNIEQYEKIIRSEREMQHISYHDSLTGLFNRSHVTEMFAQPFQELPVAVFMFDIDKLKYTNDTFGHAEGDILIRNAAAILSQSFRESDTVARIGGDEFMAIVPGCDTDMAEAIQQRINEEIRIHNHNQEVSHLQVGISSGFAIGEKEESLESMMHRADTLMYKNKRAKQSQTSIA